MLSKYVAAREKDARFNRAAVAAGLVNEQTLLDRLGTMALDVSRSASIAAHVRADFARVGRSA